MFSLVCMPLNFPTGLNIMLRDWALYSLVNRNSRSVAMGLGGHVKSGQAWTGQKRPKGGGQDRVLYRVRRALGKSDLSLVRQLRGPHLRR